MFYRDFMQKYRPLYSPDEPAAPVAAPVVVEAAAAAAADAAPAAGVVVADAAAAPPADAAPAADAAPKAEPSLLEAAEGKKPDAGAADATKEQPAPADAAKTDGDKPEAKDDKSGAEGEKPKPDGDKEKPEGDKDAAEADPAKKDATAEAQPPAPIHYEAFKLPDGIKLDDKEMAKFTEVAGKAQIPQDVAQSLVDLYVEERKSDLARAEQYQRDTWNKLNDSWKGDARKDPQIGGNRLETALARGKAVLEEYGGSPEQVKELLAHTSNNGMGNFPGFLRFLDNVAEALNIFEDSAVGETRPATKAAKGPGQRGWYDKSLNAPTS